MMTSTKHSSRRRFLRNSSVAGATLAFPAIWTSRTAHAETGTLKVGTYGGYFQDSFDKYIYPAFTEETGIKIESISEPTATAWLLILETAARAGQVPADVSMMAQIKRLKGEKAKLWLPLDNATLPNAANMPEHFVNKYETGEIYGLGAVSWYITLVSNTEVYPVAPTSWGDIWGAKYKDSLGMLALVDNSFLLEITATTFFGGTAILNTEEGILKVFKKLAEIKPNVRLWYRDEGQFQQELESGETPMGQYYHDVTGLAAADGQPVRSTFPKEGGVLESGSWCVLKTSKRQAEAQIFMNYMSQPSIQAKLSRKVGTAPTVARDKTDLTAAEFASVSSDIPPIIPLYAMYSERGDWLNQKWSELIAS